MKTYNIYKGLQKPLVFKGFKGRYIYWGVGSLILGLVSAGIIGALFSLLAGVFAMVIISVGGIYYTSMRQKDGLYDKSKSNGVIYIIPNSINQVKHGKRFKKEV